MSICQLGLHKSVQDHTNANVCKQTYDASCNYLERQSIREVRNHLAS